MVRSLKCLKSNSSLNSPCQKCFQLQDDDDIGYLV